MLEQLGDRCKGRIKPMAHLEYGLIYGWMHGKSCWNDAKGFEEGVRTNGDNQNHTTPRE